MSDDTKRPEREDCPRCRDAYGGCLCQPRGSEAREDERCAFTPCGVCKATVCTEGDCERHPEGAEMTDGSWVCSIGCWDKRAAKIGGDDVLRERIEACYTDCEDTQTDRLVALVREEKKRARRLRFSKLEKYAAKEIERADAAEKRAEEAIAELSDIYISFKETVTGKCAGDEVHCSCVPALRREIDALRERVRELETNHKGRTT